MSTFDISDAGNDILDVRDIIARVEDLREEKQDLIDAVTEAYEEREESPEDDDAISTHLAAMKAEQEWREENSEELNALESLLDEMKGCGGDEEWEGDWYPVTLIHENYFEQSMDEMISDCYSLPTDLPSFVSLEIDYDALKQDYTSVEFECHTYYYR